MEDLPPQIGAVLRGLVAVYQHVYFAAGIYFCYFVKTSLLDRFAAEGRSSDQSYAVATIVFLALSVTGNFSHSLLPFWRRVLCGGARSESGTGKPEPAGLDAACQMFFIVLLLPAAIAGCIVLVVRQWQWFAEFRAAGELAVAAPVAALATLSIISLAIVLSAFFAAVGALAAQLWSASRAAMKPAAIGPNAV